MASLAEIRAKLQQQQANSTGSTGSGDNQVYPHWDIPDNTTTTVRFLPDGDTTNTFFWVERNMINLTFPGIKGEVGSKPLTVKVPCMEMYGETCPILTEVRPWFKSKDPALDELGRKYWKKKSYLFQGFVVDNKLPDDVPPENPIRRFIISSTIFNIVKNALMDSEIEESPTDYMRGLDFKITKGIKGNYADYSSSTWSRRERALNTTEIEAIEQFKLFNLAEFLPKKPTSDELVLIKQMFEASVNGEEFDQEKWGAFNKSGSFNNTSSTRTAVVAPGVANDEPPFEPTNVPATSVAPQTPAPVTSVPASARVSDIINSIRNRGAAQ